MMDKNMTPNQTLPSPLTRGSSDPLPHRLHSAAVLPALSVRSNEAVGVYITVDRTLLSADSGTGCSPADFLQI